MERVFTLDEARALLPRVRVLALAMRGRKESFDSHRAAYDLLRARARGDDGGDRFHEPLARHYEALQRLGAEIQRDIAAVHALGAEVKGIDQGLLDFRSIRDGRVIYLCWMLDEPDIAFWHELDTGFAARQPL